MINYPTCIMKECAFYKDGSCSSPKRKSICDYSMNNIPRKAMWEDKGYNLNKDMLPDKVDTYTVFLSSEYGLVLSQAKWNGNEWETQNNQKIYAWKPISGFVKQV